jgi:hypothetical protein
MDGRTHGSGLGNHVDVVALEDDLVLLGLGLGDGDALEQLDVADALLTEEVAVCARRVCVSSRGAETEKERWGNAPDLDRLLVVGDDDVDREMGIDETHLVREPVTDAGDHVLDDAADGAEARDVLAGAVPDDELDLVDGLDGLVRGGEDADRHVGVLQVLLQGTARAGDGDNTGLDGNRDALPVFSFAWGVSGAAVTRKARTGDGTDGISSSSSL